MSKMAALVLGTAFFLSACVSSFLPLQQPADDIQPVDAQATDVALAATLALETLDALPTPTIFPATDTSTLLPTSTKTAMVNATETATLTNLDATATASVTPTETLVSATYTPAAATETNHPRFYGTQPPNIPSGKARLVNKAKADVYVSLQCTTVDGHYSIAEYPVSGSMKVSIPAGKYDYVAWVGGKKYTGQFRLSENDDVTITFYIDRVIVK